MASAMKFSIAKHKLKCERYHTKTLFYPQNSRRFKRNNVRTHILRANNRPAFQHDAAFCAESLPILCGSSRIAAALLHEKHLSAACCHGNHSYCRCSFGASFTGSADGSSRLNTCSRLCVVPGAKRPRQFENISNRYCLCQLRNGYSIASRPVSSPTSRTAVSSSNSSSFCLLPVTDCQNPGRSARSISSTCKSVVCITTKTETGIL